jgi:ABC-type Fe3+-hydroxamate transport system substrate-binding protein
MFKYVLIGFLALLLLSACATATEEPAVVDDGEGTLVTVYRAPT